MITVLQWRDIYNLTNNEIKFILKCRSNGALLMPVYQAPKSLLFLINNEAIVYSEPVSLSAFM